MHYCWSPRGRLWPGPPAAVMSTAPACTAGWGSIAQGGMRPRSRIGRGVVGRGRAVSSRRGSYAGNWVTASRSGGGLCWRRLDLDAIAEPDTLDDLRQLVLALQAAPGLGRGHHELEDH